jgi:hypothetical protein
MADPTRHHAVIAGTGRAGTSFLVKFLGTCGLDIGASAGWHETARAGLERNLVLDATSYVIKDPWLSTYCNEIDLENFHIDALIVPVRDLDDSAKSRILQERIAMSSDPELLIGAADVRGGAPGGVIYSLDPVDQARLLAVEFHRLIHWSTKNQLPLFLLDFPRLVQDESYLIESLWPWLSHHCSREAAHSAFATVVDPSLVRLDSSNGTDVDLESKALRTLVQQRTSELQQLDVERAHLERELSSARGTIHALEAKNKELDATNGALSNDVDRLGSEVVDLTHTVSWRLTRPLRWARRRFRWFD